MPLPGGEFDPGGAGAYGRGQAGEGVARPESADEPEAALKDVTGREGRLQYRDGKGSLQIDFYSDAQLSRYAELLGQYDPETAGDAKENSAEHFD